MVRQHTLLSQRPVAQQSPRYHKPTRTSHRTSQFAKSPLATKAQLSKVGRARLRGSRRLLSKPLLPTIEEEEEEEYVAQRPDYDVRFDLDTFERDEKRAFRSRDDEMMDWDEESTLISLFHDDKTEAGTESDLSALAEKLRAQMSAQSAQLKQYMHDTVLPVMRRVKQVHDTLEDDVDVAYGTGLLAFDEVCKRVEAMALRTEDEVKTTHLKSQANVRRLLGELADAYQRRAHLWTELEEKLAKCADRGKAAIEALPGDVEATIARLEKKSKEMDKGSGSAAAKQKILKELLQQL